MGGDGMSDIRPKLWWNGSTGTKSGEHGPNQVLPTTCRANSYTYTAT